ncbi:hypothetical protein RO3G_15229 [Rhizopus delemar RA 99-880]|uniref:Uncharacterized protein n=1 Tax=Rhizopus delemar (strain RA 99-880 / ATCC MYA-4621 / FGSC 9543 / NRRL 43880) TaxID=246409 RepID=I1CPY8_RHIO9|nr:hypothetical protein RO3G_15229 [Rhizopus delemar RA 99-880]|eukprot:EIE90518.1 hypothetical protein RO3G_15229 [Rhizopus delemar RA 99-880]
MFTKWIKLRLCFFWLRHGLNQLNLEADESEMIVCYTTSTTNNEETAEGNIDETEENDNTEQDEQRVDIVECKKRLKEAYETILMYKFPLDDLDLVKNICVAPLNRATTVSGDTGFLS